MSVLPHAPTAPPLSVRIGGRLREIDTPRAALGKLGFALVDDGWVVFDGGLSGGLFCLGERVKHRTVPHGTTSWFRIGAPDGPEVEVRAPALEDPVPDPVPAPVVAPPRARPTLIARRLAVQSPEGQDLLSGVDLALEPGTLTAVIGPSGAGKSTLLRALAGQTPVAAGGVWWRGHDVHDDRAELRTLIGHVPQEEIQHPQLSVRRSLEFSARLRLPPGSAYGERVDAVLESVGLTDQARQRIDQLSGGQRKRVSIATELLTAPPLLFLDEPTSGLDPGRERQVMQQLRALADEPVSRTDGLGRIVVVATHSVLGLDLCDTVVVVARGGRVVHVGPPSGLLEHFECEDFPGLFELLESQERHLASTEPTRALVSRRHVSAPVHSAVLQFATLVRRNVSLLLADRLHLAMLLIMPLVLAVLTRVVQGSAGLTSPGEAGQRLTILVVAATLIGTAMTIRELVEERAIYRREHAVGLSPGAYWASKVTVFGVVCFLQGVLVVWLALVGLPRPDWVHVAVAIGLLATVMAFVGLWVSGLVRTPEQTAPALVAVVMSQVVLSSTLVRIDGRPVLEQLSWLAPARWAHAAAASSVDLDAARKVPDALFEPTTQVLAADLAALVLLGIVVLGLGAQAVRRRR